MKKIIKLVKKRKLLIIHLLLLFVLVDVAVLVGQSDIRYFGVLGLLFILYLITKFKSIHTFIFCLVLLLILYGFYLIKGPIESTEEVAVWFVLFFAFGIFQKWKE